MGHGLSRDRDLPCSRRFLEERCRHRRQIVDADPRPFLVTQRLARVRLVRVSHPPPLRLLRLRVPLDAGRQFPESSPPLRPRLGVSMVPPASRVSSISMRRPLPYDVGPSHPFARSASTRSPRFMFS